MSVFLRGLLCAALLAVSARARADQPGAPEPKSTPPVLIYMRTERQPLTFTARAKSRSATPSWCASPCSARLEPGEYELRLNGVQANGGLQLRRSGTLYGQYHSHEAARTGGWLALNVGGIIGGVFVTVAALGGPSWAYAAGGGALAAGGLAFYLSYRPDTASVGFTPSAPADVEGMPLPAEAVALSRRTLEQGSLGMAPRSFGVRILF